MPEAVVVAQYVNPVQPGKKNGSIKTPEGQYYGVPPAMLGMFKEGGTYKIFYESSDFKGKTYFNVKTVSEVMAPPPKTEAATSGGHQAERSLEIWVNSMTQCAAKTEKLDLWNEEACCEFGEIQKRVHHRLFLGGEPVMPRANGPTPTQQLPNPDRPLQSVYKTGPAPGHNDMNDEIPF